MSQFSELSLDELREAARMVLLNGGPDDFHEMTVELDRRGIGPDGEPEPDTAIGVGDTVLPDANPRKAIIGGVAYYALCWMQPGPGQFSTCDRVLGHEGGHSWESGL